MAAKNMSTQAVFFLHALARKFLMKGSSPFGAIILYSTEQRAKHLLRV
jgi:hypothetical protein